MRTPLMKTIILSIVCLLFCSLSTISAQDSMPDAPRRVPLADPFILQDNGIYYAYGTDSPDGISVFVSEDLRQWQRGEGRATGGLALHKEDSYGDRWFWAPEVYRKDDRYYMFFSADEHTCIATADSPLGPFKVKDRQPLIPDERTIDNSLFIDKDGTPYMFFVRLVNRNSIWCMEMTQDLLHVKPETMVFCLKAEQPWERVEGDVAEGPFVIQRKGVYYLTYSANGYQSHDYAVGCATATSPKGPWKKVKNNPILHSCSGLVGLGHHSFFSDKHGKLRIVFHAHNSPDNVHPRNMFISNVSFISLDDGQPTLDIDKRFIFPELKRE